MDFEREVLSALGLLNSTRINKYQYNESLQIPDIFDLNFGGHVQNCPASAGYMHCR